MERVTGRPSGLRHGKQHRGFRAGGKREAGRPGARTGVADRMTGSAPVLSRAGRRERCRKGRCRILLPGSCGPRLRGLTLRTWFRDTRTAYAARAIAGARLSLATMQFGPITVVPHRDKAIPFTRSSILFRPHSPPTRVVWWSRRVPPPGPIRLLRARLCP